MSFNLRVPFVLDTFNHWTFRKPLTAETIQDYSPDLLGTQECLAEMASYLRSELPDYNFIGVGREDGSTATFVVDKVASYSKARFPTAEVYGNTTSRAELRLITCGGSFDDHTGHYVDNVVAFAHLVSAA